MNYRDRTNYKDSDFTIKGKKILISSTPEYLRAGLANLMEIQWLLENSMFDNLWQHYGAYGCTFCKWFLAIEL